MLELTNVTKYYGKTLAADQVSFSIPDGAVGVLLGPNGGKIHHHQEYCRSAEI